MKPSSATVVVKLDLEEEDRRQAVDLIRRGAGEEFEVEPLEGGRVRLTLPQANYRGGNHGSVPDREHDAIDVANRALDRVRHKLWWRGWSDRMEVVDYFTSKSAHPLGRSEQTPVRTHVTLDLRVSVGDDRDAVLAQLRQVMGSGFELRLLGGPEELDAHVRRLSHQSPLFVAAEQAIHETYGQSAPVLFGNTTASNDVRYLMNAAPESQALTFVPVLFSENGAHGPDEAVTVDSLRTGVDWTVRFIQRIGRR
ncbi:MAG: M20/M25/M40 family metallo-hydrolase [Armatimonadetes bacterium]|nr:M20/M25/M40 family metallo-hydrolase [Armatimonadota bacterium]